MTTWLLTQRTLPTWLAIRELLQDGQWHPIDTITTTAEHNGLSPRTIQNHLPAAARQRWIQRHNGQIKIRDLNALDAALLGCPLAAEDDDLLEAGSDG